MTTKKPKLSDVSGNYRLSRRCSEPECTHSYWKTAQNELNRQTKQPQKMYLKVTTQTITHIHTKFCTRKKNSGKNGTVKAKSAVLFCSKARQRCAESSVSIAVSRSVHCVHQPAEWFDREVNAAGEDTAPSRPAASKIASYMRTAINTFFWISSLHQKSPTGTTYHTHHLLITHRHTTHIHLSALLLSLDGGSWATPGPHSFEHTHTHHLCTSYYSSVWTKRYKQNTIYPISTLILGQSVCGCVCMRTRGSLMAWPEDEAIYPTIPYHITNKQNTHKRTYQMEIQNRHTYIYTYIHYIYIKYIYIYIYTCIIILKKNKQR